MATTGAEYLPPGHGRSIWWLGGRGTFLALGDETGGHFALWVDQCPPGGGPPPHIHSLEDEFFYVLRGELTYRTAGRSFEATPGAFVVLPRGIPHRFRNGEAPGRLLVFVAPGGNERLFLDLAVPDSATADPTDEPDPAAFEAAAKLYGVTLLPPDDPDWEAHRLPVGEGRMPTLHRPGEGERLDLGAATVVLKATGAETAGSYTSAEIGLPPGAALPDSAGGPHAVGIYVLEGTPTIAAGDWSVRAAADGFVRLASGVSWTLNNRSRYPARLLLMAAPSGLEESFRRLAASG